MPGSGSMHDKRCYVKLTFEKPHDSYAPSVPQATRVVVKREFGRRWNCSVARRGSSRDAKPSRVRVIDLSSYFRAEAVASGYTKTASRPVGPRR
jgi:hypothetical protein